MNSHTEAFDRTRQGQRSAKGPGEWSAKWIQISSDCSRWYRYGRKTGYQNLYRFRDLFLTSDLCADLQGTVREREINRLMVMLLTPFLALMNRGNSHR